MKRFNVLSIYLFTIFIISCNSQQSNTQIYQPHKVPDYISSYIKEFDIDFNSQIGADSNSIFFYYAAHFDTSFSVHLVKQDSEIIGVLREVLPEYHKDLDDYADKNSRLLFFEGYSFRIDQRAWDRIVVETRNPSFWENDTSTKKEPCADCPSYFLAHALNIRTGNSNNRVAFQAYAQFLKDSILNQYIEKRKPKLIKK